LYTPVQDQVSSLRIEDLQSGRKTQLIHIVAHACSTGSKRQNAIDAGGDKRANF